MAAVSSDGQAFFAIAGIMVGLIGFVMRKPASVLVPAQAAWDKTWVCK